ncbi:Ferredoxin--nitrite reductase [Sulfurimonas gotlandica GD1]|uniref:Ferredoxin--nitrite reductase n=1 Tax=Sulfurimonas gotlandica (strain DSM 19862 / JCM 16533 / GD1) TaxID=929558 RepID=H1FZH3_SULGG|nr:nitrite/sulfite reductase [Sulfurimonas gotlandica]EHP30980.1 Ferredoxin--nitrite reductase [Sulfurimonas gotlandica GD1]
MQTEEPKLNKRERYKARLRPIDYFEEFEDLDFENLGEGDRFFLQDFGIFTTDFLEDEFTMRLRVPAGRITTEQFSYIADVVEEFDLTVITTARGGLQLHDIDVDDVLAIWKKLNSHGLTTWQSFGDNIRNIVSDAFDGRGKYSEIEAYPIIMQMQDYIVKNPRYVGMLPRRVSIGISGNSASVTSFFANDLYFALAKKNDVYGFNVYMGGKNTDIAQDADIFLLETQVFDFFKAFVEAFYLHGSRFSRSKTRLFYLIEDIGLNVLKAHIEKEYGKAFEHGGELQLEKKLFSAHEELKDGTFSYCYQTDFARLNVDEMKEISKFASQNSVEIRIGVDQNIYLLGLKEASTPFASPKESSTIITCAGSLCPYSFWSIKNETQYLPLTKIAEHGITVGFSGCIKGCGRHRHTDIGLVGLKTNNFGDTDGGARIFIGAVHTTGQSVGRMLFSMVPLVHLYETLELIIKLYELSEYSNFEEFSDAILNKFSEEFLALWVLANLQSGKALKLEPTSSGFEYEKSLLKTNFADVDFLEPIDEEFSHSISAMAKKLWTVAGEDPTYKPKINRVNFR